jgi:flagellar protein FlaI
LGADASLAIEEKVDDIINSHAEVFKRGKTVGKTFSPKNSQDKNDNSLFFFASKKKTSIQTKIELEKKPPKKKTKKHLRIGKRKNVTPVPVVSKSSVQGTSVSTDFSLWKKQKKENSLTEKKPKKHLGFRKKKRETPPMLGGDISIETKPRKKHVSFWKRQKKERIPITSEPEKQSVFGKKKKKEPSAANVKPVLSRHGAKSGEQLSQFEESIAQIRPDEATWVDQQILAKATENKTSEIDHSKKIKGIQTASNKQTKSTTDWEHESPEEGRISKIGVAVPDDSFWVKKERNSGDAAPSAFDEPGPGPDPKKIKFDEITPDGQIKFLNEAKKLKYIVLNQLGYSDDSIEEIDFYPLREPFSYVEIIREKESLDKRYVLIEVQLTGEEQKFLNFIKETLGGFAFKTEELEEKGEAKYLNEKVDQIIDDYLLKIDAQSKKKIMFYLEKEFLGLGKLEVLMKDPNIEDISCDGSGVYIFLYHRRFGSLKSNVKFNDEDELTAFVVKLAQKCNKHISIAEPMLDATMPDGSRIQMTLSTEVTTKGSTFTIRKFSEDPFSPPDLIEFNTMSSEMVAYMWLAVENGVNALIAGGTAAGKTSTMNAISLFIPRESKIVSIEETREINLPHPNWIPGVVRSGFGEVVGNKVIGEIDLYDLMKAALRQRPEYILVGEIRGKEAYVLFQAMATGHTTYSTVHADSAQSLIHRLEGKPIEIPRIMLQALDIVCIQVISRVKDKRARRCKQIIEIIDIDPTTKEILTNEVFRWDPIEDKFIYSGKSYILERIRAEKDISREEMISEIKNRASLLEWMNKNNIREFKKVATVVAQYVDNPTEIIKKIKIDA